MAVWMVGGALLGGAAPARGAEVVSVSRAGFVFDAGTVDGLRDGDRVTWLRQVEVTFPDHAVAARAPLGNAEIRSIGRSLALARPFRHTEAPRLGDEVKPWPRASRVSSAAAFPPPPRPRTGGARSPPSA